ncbi:MAG: hypothetical protein K0R20_1500 [Actinomycetia bacterium]|jgi:hypothetical protein|nr:hypothetical protein [Actinomycetes bacterium]
MRTRIKKVLAITTLAATILPSGATEAFATAPPRVRVSAVVACLPLGGIGINLTLENDGPRVARIDPDIHLLIEPVRVGGRQPGVILFVFPAPDFARIPPAESRTFLLTAGEPFEGEPPADLSGSRILMELDVWLRHRDRPLARTLSFPAC